MIISGIFQYGGLLFTSFYLNSEVIIIFVLHYELWMILFLIAALVCFFHYRRTHSIRYYILALFSAILAGLSKETAAILPLFLLAVDYHISHGIFPPKVPSSRDIGRALLVHLPFWFIAIPIAWLAARAQGYPGYSPGTTLSQYLDSTYWYIIYTLSPCFITDRLTIILAFSIMVGLGWLFYRSTPQKRALIIALTACIGFSFMPYIALWPDG